MPLISSILFVLLLCWIHLLSISHPPTDTPWNRGRMELSFQSYNFCSSDNWDGMEYCCYFLVRSEYRRNSIQK